MQSSYLGTWLRRVSVTFLVSIILTSSYTAAGTGKQLTPSNPNHPQQTSEHPVVRADADFIGWGVRRINATKAWNDTQGEGMRIAVLDTGIDWTHLDLGGVVAGGICIICNSSTTSAYSWLDHNGHGTAVAGVIGAQRNGFGVLGVSYRAELYAVKVLNDSGVGFVSDVAAGIDWSVQNQMNIIVMSFSSPDFTQAEADAVQNAYSKGLLLVASAGNNGPADGTVGYPAAFPSVMAIGAIDYGNQVPSWSSRGTQIDLAAPGVGINTTWIDEQYVSLSGTSMSAPYVAASAALVWSASRNLTNLQVRSILERTAHPLGSSVRDIATGFGLVDSLRSVNLALNRNLSFQPLNLTVTLDMIKLTRGKTLTARILVLDADGQAVAGLMTSASISSVERTYWNTSVQTEMNGWAILHILITNRTPDGEYQLKVDASGFLATRSITIVGAPPRQQAFSAWDKPFILSLLLIFSSLAVFHRSRSGLRTIRESRSRRP